MQIGYSEETLKSNINKQFDEIESEYKWMLYYYSQKGWDCVEDCARNIQDSLVVILENLENLKGESL